MLDIILLDATQKKIVIILLKWIENECIRIGKGKYLHCEFRAFSPSHYALKYEIMAMMMTETGIAFFQRIAH